LQITIPIGTILVAAIRFWQQAAIRLSLQKGRFHESQRKRQEQFNALFGGGPLGYAAGTQGKTPAHCVQYLAGFVKDEWKSSGEGSTERAQGRESAKPPVGAKSGDTREKYSRDYIH
jgi:hypothetical protein